ncbi:putative transporter [Photorhabdus australis subsp. thailandensis]|uniref:Putative transporter n=1 Tax=Photorhabdus australis subsp. thailandensis TaxID=2805096 RepID=A0A1C0U8S8_9GAMM|nr:MFS transporter [Photorhabdus australis]OCQ54276.1 putative transporter [Photorhabdus australis subsp. thailandensis]
MNYNISLLHIFKNDRTVSFFLFSSLLLTIGRGASLPYLAIYLSVKFNFSPIIVGYIISSSMIFGIITSLAGGMFADNKKFKFPIVSSLLIFLFCFLIFPYFKSIIIISFLLALVNLAYSLFDVLLKSYFSDYLPQSIKIRLFSLNYTLINVGWSVGPLIGALLSGYSHSFPFIFSGFTAVLPMVFIIIYYSSCFHSLPILLQSNNRLLTDTLSHMKPLNNHLLFMITTASVLGTFVYGSTISYLSQYLIVYTNKEFSYTAIAAMMVTNAVVVIGFQYHIGKHIKDGYIGRWMTGGLIFFILGILGFIYSEQNLIYWIIAMFSFSLGEIIFIPVLYALTDSIAPEGLRGHYFAIQNLGSLGAAVSPVLMGYLISHYKSPYIFLTLIVVISFSYFILLVVKHAYIKQ